MKQEIFKKLDLVKNDDVDTEAAQTFIENAMKDADWKKVMKNVVAMCNKEMGEIAEKYQKQSNMTKEQCNIKYSLVIDCVQIAAFAVSFSL